MLYKLSCKGTYIVKVMWYSVREKEFKLMDWLVMLLKKPRSTDGGDG